MTTLTDNDTRVRLLRSTPPSGSHLSLSPEHPGGPRPPRCVCRLSPQGGPRMGPALSPPSPCCMCLRIGRPRGPAARIRVRVYRPHHTAGPPRRFTTGCRPVVARGEHSQGGSDPSPANDTCVGLVARPVRWPSVFEASRWGVTGRSGLFFDLRRAVH